MTQYDEIRSCLLLLGILCFLAGLFVLAVTVGGVTL